MPAQVIGAGFGTLPKADINPPVKATPTPAPELLTPGEFTGELITIPLDLPAGAKPLEMVLIPAGTFTMGCPSSERGYYGYEWPPHEVTINNDFYMAKYEVTQAQWDALECDDGCGYCDIWNFSAPVRARLNLNRGWSVSSGRPRKEGVCRGSVTRTGYWIYAH